jgi:Putative peptidoglycan binding domain
MVRLPPRRVFRSRRVLVVAVAALAVAGVAAGVAAAAGGGRGGTASPSGGGQLTTAAVVRTTLVNTVQVGGSIGFDGSYTVAAPSGTSASTIRQDQQAITADEQTLSADEQAESDAAATDNQTTADAQTSVSADQAALSADQAQEASDCAGSGASSTACSQDKAKVSQDHAALSQARQQLASAQTAAKTDHDRNQATVAADQTRLTGDQATLATDQATAVNPGTTYTWLPQPGQVIKQDETVYSVSDVPVPLLYGSIPAWRAFYTGMPDGGDVGELTHDLIALGYGSGLTQSDHYSAATAAAVGRWQAALGLPVTGQILLGEVVFEPGPIRVTSVTPSAGASAGGGGSGGSGGGGGAGGTVLTATGTTPVVTVDLDVTQDYLVKPGDAVSVVLPDGTSTVGGQVESVGTVASCPGGGSTGTGTGTGSSGTGGGGQSPCASAGSNGASGSNSSPTVTVTITLDSTPAGARLDQAPVNVNITSERAANVLAVPVNALLALAGGGFGVQVVTGDTSHLVGVSTGLYSSTLVQVSGPGIRAGMRVEVPAQ